MTPTLLLQLVINGLIFGGLLALVALGLALIFGVMRLVNFAHGIFVTLGAYATYLLVANLKLSPLAGIPVSALIGAAIGLVVQELVIRRLDNRPDLEKLMVTYALAIIGLGFFSATFGGDFRSYSAGPRGNIAFLGATIGWRNLVVLGVCAIAGLATILMVDRSRVGLGLRALAQNRDAAATSGVNVNLLQRYAFGLASALAAVSGSLISMIGTTTPQVGEEWLLSSFVVVVIGGMGSIGGAIAAGIAVGLVQSFASYFTDDGWARITIFMLLYVVLVLRPRGILGRGLPI